MRGVGPEPDRARVFHAADQEADAERMRALAGEAVGRLEAEVRESCEVLPSTVALGLVAGIVEAEAGFEAGVGPGVEAGVVVEVPATEDEAVAAAVQEAAFVAEAVAELEAIIEPEAVVAAVAEAGAVVAEAEPEIAAETEQDIETEPETAAEPGRDTEAEGQSAPTVAAAPLPIAAIRLESGPSTLDLPMPGYPPVTAQASIASPAPAVAALAVPGAAPAPAAPATVSEPSLAPKPVIATVSQTPSPIPTVAIAEPPGVAIPAPAAQAPAPQAPAAPAVRRLPTARVQPVPQPGDHRDPAGALFGQGTPVAPPHPQRAVRRHRRLRVPGALRVAGPADRRVVDR